MPTPKPVFGRLRKWDWSGLCPFSLRKVTGRGQPEGEGGGGTYHTRGGSKLLVREGVNREKLTVKKIIIRERGNRALVIVLESWPFLRLRNAFKYSVFEASRLVPTKTLLLKHYYRRQG